MCYNRSMRKTTNHTDCLNCQEMLEELIAEELATAVIGTSEDETLVELSTVCPDNGCGASIRL